MGNVLLVHQFEEKEFIGQRKPIIYCYFDNTRFSNAISLNCIIAEKLSVITPRQRTRRLSACFEEILKTLPDNVVIKDFDVMFNPDYKVDVLKIMVDVCKRKPFSIIWPGKCEDGRLFYAENGYPDFKVFSVEEYDVICIV